MSAYTRRRAIAALAAVFVAGVFSGVVLDQALIEVTGETEWTETLGSEADDDEGELGEILAGMDLTAEQRTRIERILERREERLEDYWSSGLPEIRAIIDSTRAEVRAILTPEQRVIYNRRLAERRSGASEEAARE